MPAGSHSGPESSKTVAPRIWTVWPLCTAILAAYRLSSRVLSAPLGRRAPKALCCPAYGAPSQHWGPRRGTGVQGAWGRRAPGPLPPAAQATRPFPHKNKKGRKKENSSGRAAPKAAPHCLPACASGAGSRLWRNMVCAVRPSPQKDARQGAMAKIQSVPVPARKDRHGTGPNPRHRAAAAGAGTGRPSGRPPRPGPWR